MKVAVFLEHDITYRHFIKSRVFADLAAKHEVMFVFPAIEPANKRLMLTPLPAEVGADFTYIPVNFRRLFQWRRLFQVMQLQWRPGANWKNIRVVMRRNVGAKAANLYTVLGLPGIFGLFRRWSERQIAREPTEMAAFLDRFRPGMMIHPTVLDGYFINDFVKLGRERGIPTIAIMNSWDNPGTKRAVIGQPDWLLVWGPQTRDLAIQYMGIAPERTVCFGAAQFDIYRNPPRIAREEFCRRHDIDPAKRILLYAGSSKGSDEFAHLCMIEEAIDQGRLGNAAVVYRPHPWGRGGYKGERLLDHPWRHVRIESSMRDYLEQIRIGKKPTYLADYADTHDVLSSVDALVSPLSTIILEAAMHGKPVLCFLPDEKDGSSLHLQAQFVHFHDMFDSPMTLMAEGDAALIGKLAELMGRIGDADFARKLEQGCAHFVEPHAQPFAERLTAFVEQAAAWRGN